MKVRFGSYHIELNRCLTADDRRRNENFGWRVTRLDALAKPQINLATGSFQTPATSMQKNIGKSFWALSSIRQKLRIKKLIYLPPAYVVRRKVMFSQASGKGGCANLHPIILPLVPCLFWGGYSMP